MRLTYISLVDLASRSGAVDHVLGIARGLAERGHEVRLVAPVGPAGAGPAADLAGIGLVPVAAGGTGAMAWRLAAAARADLERHPPELVYLRSFPLDWPVVARGLVARGTPYVLELNAMTDTEYAAKGRPWLVPAFSWSDRRTLAGARAWLPVTDEIRAWAERASGVRRPHARAMNGIWLDDLAPRRGRAEVRRALGVAPDAPVMAMLGFAAPWHGAERAIAMLPHLPPASELWLIGARSAAERGRVEAAAAALGVTARVRIFRWMPPAEAADLMAAADLALGPLALDKKAMAEAQSIKVPYGLALGLPLLLNYRDLRVPDGLPFVRRVEGHDPVALAAAAATLMANRPAPEAIRAFARAQLTWGAAAARTEPLLAAALAAEAVAA